MLGVLRDTSPVHGVKPPWAPPFPGLLRSLLPARAPMQRSPHASADDTNHTAIGLPPSACVTASPPPFPSLHLPPSVPPALPPRPPGSSPLSASRSAPQAHQRGRPPKQQASPAPPGLPPCFNCWFHGPRSCSAPARRAFGVLCNVVGTSATIVWEARPVRGVGPFDFMVEGRTSREVAGGAGPKTWRLVVDGGGRETAHGKHGGLGQEPSRSAGTRQGEGGGCPR